MQKNIAVLPDWELVLSAAARLQSILPGAILVGGTASAIHASNAMPYDLDETELSQYKNLDPRWHDWRVVKGYCAHLATVIFDKVCDLDNSGESSKDLSHKLADR